MKIIVRNWAILAFLILMGFALQKPGAVTAVPPAQDDPTPTDDFGVIPSEDQEEQDDPESTITPEPTVIRIDSTTVTPAVILEEELPGAWQRPQNLSRSGATTDPQMVRDNEDNLHVLWQDAIDGFVYTRGNNEDWSAPLAPELPFATRRFFPDLEPEDETPLFQPYLIAGGGDDIHAFWIDTLEDRQTLFHSSVPADEFSDFDAWSSRQSLSSAALKMSASVDSDGVLHLIYIRSAESADLPSGIYYRRLDRNGEWSGPVLLYDSRYLRGVERAQANLQILAGENDYIYAVWDDTGKEQVFFTRSANGGVTWSPIQEIDRRSPEDDQEAIGPSQIKVGAIRNEVLLTWRGGHEPGQVCSQYMMISMDNGENWNFRQNLENLADCLASAQFVPTGQGLFLLGTVLQEGPQRNETVSTTYLMAWDGRQWSNPQVQEPLSAFTNPDTFQPVRLQCLQAIGGEDQIMTIGCDSGNGQDIWLTAREIGVIGTWYPPPPIWQGPESIGSSDVQAVDVQLVADDAGSTHAFWHDDQSQEIYHAAWNGQGWSAGRPIINALNGNVQEIAAAAGNERLYLVFRDGSSGLYFSQASSERPSEWSEPLKVAENHPAAVSPSILADDRGQVNIAYAVPLNERRGIYLIQSENAGDSWTLPIQVFDGTEAGWDMVDWPRIAATADNQLHILWSRRSLPPEAQPLALAYSRSEDAGRNWTEAEIIDETPALWSQLIGLNERLLHRLWAVENNDRLVIWHEYSQDNGLSWSQEAQVTGVAADTIPALAVDAGNRPHILSIDEGRLLDLFWSDERWMPGDDLAVPFTAGGLLAAAGDRQNRLLVLYAGLIPGTEGGEADAAEDLFAMSRTLQIPTELLAPLPTLTPTPMPTSTPQATPTPTPEPTVAFSPVQERGLIRPIPGLPTGTDASASLILLAIIPAGIIVLISIIVGVRIARRR